MQVGYSFSFKNITFLFQDEEPAVDNSNSNSDNIKCDGGDSCCTEEYPCGENEGDCDSDSDCANDLICGKDNCPRGTTFEDNDDCCEVLGIHKFSGHQQLTIVDIF